MTNPYHVTPEHALKLFDEAGGILDIDDKRPLAVSATDLANFANAVLDKVLGEPVAYQTPLRYGSKVTHNKPVKPDNWDDELIEWFCEPLYAPKVMT